jgi:hypothetical protein
VLRIGPADARVICEVSVDVGADTRRRSSGRNQSTATAVLAGSEKVRNRHPTPNIDRVVTKNRFRPMRVSLFIVALAELSNEEFSHLSHGKSNTCWLSSKALQKIPKAHFSKASGPGCVVQSGRTLA